MAVAVAVAVVVGRGRRGGFKKGGAEGREGMGLGLGEEGAWHRRGGSGGDSVA